MSLLSQRLILCRNKKKALIAFNIQNIYHLNALFSLSKNNKVPVIAQVSKKYIDVFDELYGLTQIVEKYQSEYLTFHLDHCNDYDVIFKCIDAGFKSVMFDGSSLPVSENILGTNKVYERANRAGCLVEAELGAIGGVEDGEGTENTDVFLIDDLVKFSENANFDMLALAIGNAHGHYSSTQGINVELLKEAIDLVGEKHLVLHGATGLPDDLINRSISYGVVKINVSTGLKSKTIELLAEFAKNNSEYNESSFLSYTKQELGSFYMDFINKFTI